MKAIRNFFRNRERKALEERKAWVEKKISLWWKYYHHMDSDLERELKKVNRRLSELNKED